MWFQSSLAFVALISGLVRTFWDIITIGGQAYGGHRNLSKREWNMRFLAKDLGIDQLRIAERILLVEESWDGIAAESG